MKTYLSDVTDQLKILSRTLNTDYIGHIGLLSAIEVEINRIKLLRRFQVHSKTISGISNLDKNQEIMIFRVFQEIMHNALSHSEAKNAYIDINNANGNFELKIEDDGNGFDVENTMQSKKASGLMNILKRAKWAGMDCTIDSVPGRGSTIILRRIPVVQLKT